MWIPSSLSVSTHYDLSRTSFFFPSEISLNWRKVSFNKLHCKLEYYYVVQVYWELAVSGVANWRQSARRHGINSETCRPNNSRNILFVDYIRGAYYPKLGLSVLKGTPLSRLHDVPAGSIFNIGYSFSKSVIERDLSDDESFVTYATTSLLYSPIQCRSFSFSLSSISLSWCYINVIWLLLLSY